MKQRLILIGALIVFVLTVFLMIRDMFQQKSLETNPYEYSIDNYKKIDTNDFCYEVFSELNEDFNKLNAITIDQKDNIIIADSNVIRIFNYDLEPINSFNLYDEISSIHAGNKDTLYVGLAKHIEVWHSTGKKISEWSVYEDRSILTSITSSEEHICVADAGTKRLLLYNKAGRLIRTMGEKDGAERKFGFMIPSPYFDVDVSRDGYFWATNPGLHTLEAYDSLGRLVSHWNRTSMDMDGFSGCCNPTHFCLLSDDHFVTVEKGLVRIKIHEPTGNYKCAVDGPLSFKEKETGMDIVANSKDDIIVLVPSENTIRIYRKKPGK